MKIMFLVFKTRTDTPAQILQNTPFRHFEFDFLKNNVSHAM